MVANHLAPALSKLFDLLQGLLWPHGKWLPHSFGYFQLERERVFCLGLGS